MQKNVARGCSRLVRIQKKSIHLVPGKGNGREEGTKGGTAIGTRQL